MLKPSFAYFRSFMAAATVVIALGSLAGCRLQTNHPGQISSFDGSAYDALVLTHGALSALRTPVANNYPELIATYNRVAGSYDRAVDIYKLFRTQGSTESDASVALADVVISLGTLEVDLEATLKVPAQARQARAAQHQLAAQTSVAQGHAAGIFSVQNLLTELQLASTIAAAVRGDEAQLQAANVILQATRQALNDWSAAANQPINVTSLGVIEPIEILPAQ